MLQGMARGKVGDVVFSRLNGEQISRVRNRHPKNPRSNKQLYQRAIMATVMQAYSQGMEIFNHAFEGKTVGAMCQREFMRLNAKALRSRLATDIAAVDQTTTIGRVTAPGIATIIPNEYIISRGSYQNSFFTQNGATFRLPAAVENETVAQYATRNGLIPGDIYTFVMIANDGDDVLFSTYGDLSTNVDKVLRGNFAYVRFTVKDVSAINTPVAEEELATFFIIETSAGLTNAVGTDQIDEDVELSVLWPNADDQNGYAIGLIRSRQDVDLRSNSVLTVHDAQAYGLKWSAIVDAWKKGTESIGDSDLILEGGDEI